MPQVTPAHTWLIVLTLIHSLGHLHWLLGLSRLNAHIHENVTALFENILTRIRETTNMYILYVGDDSIFEALELVQRSIPGIVATHLRDFHVSTFDMLATLAVILACSTVLLLDVMRK